MSRDRTHWEDCWRVHHECAIAKIERQSEQRFHEDEDMSQADLIELAATWCDSTAASESHAAVAQLWRTRAKMLRDGYQPNLVRARSSEADSGARRDTARLDWLEQQSAHGLIIDIVADWTYNGRRYGAGMRDAIDAAMSARNDTSQS